MKQLSPRQQEILNLIKQKDIGSCVKSVQVIVRVLSKSENLNANFANEANNAKNSRHSPYLRNSR